jgi:hypothetical protein
MSEEKKFMQRTTLHLLAMFSIAAAAYACGGDDGKTPEASTGLPAEAKLSELESSEAPALCEAIEAGIEDVLPESEVKRLGCTFAAVLSMNLSEESSEVDVDACESYVDDCIAGKTSETSVGIDLEEWSSQTTCDESAVTERIGECDATVAEYEACLDAALQAFATLREALRCSAFEDPDKVRDALTMPDPALSDACKPFEQKCAGLFDDLRGL